MPEQCAECGNTYRTQLAWKSELLSFMVEDLTPEQLATLIDALDEAVKAVATEFSVGQ